MKYKNSLGFMIHTYKFWHFTSVVVVVKILVLGQPCLESKDLSVLGQDLSVLGSVGCSQVLELPLDIVRDRNKVLAGIHWLLCIHHLVLEEIVNLIHLLMGVHPLLAVRVKVLAAEEYNAPSEPLEMLVWSMGNGHGQSWCHEPPPAYGGESEQPQQQSSWFSTGN